MAAHGSSVESRSHAVKRVFQARVC
jgi:hypothetical protein